MSYTKEWFNFIEHKKELYDRIEFSKKEIDIFLNEYIKIQSKKKNKVLNDNEYQLVKYALKVG